MRGVIPESFRERTSNQSRIIENRRNSSRNKFSSTFSTLTQMENHFELEFEDQPAIIEVYLMEALKK